MDVSFQFRHDYPFDNFDEGFVGSDQRNEPFLKALRDQIHFLSTSENARILSYFEVNRAVLQVVQLANEGRIQRKITFAGDAAEVGRMALLYAYFQAILSQKAWRGSYELWACHGSTEVESPDKLEGSPYRNLADIVRRSCLLMLGIPLSEERLRVSLLNLPDLADYCLTFADRDPGQILDGLMTP